MYPPLDRVSGPLTAISGAAPWTRRRDHVTMRICRGREGSRSGSRPRRRARRPRLPGADRRPRAFHDSGRSLAIVAVGWSFLLAGLVAWSRRAGNRVGPLMIAAGFALLLRQLRYSHDPLLFTVFFALGHLGYGLVAHSCWRTRQAV